MTHVLIVGGGIGGLALAQGLRGQGVSVAVYERDRTPTAREQGYRLHVDPTGSRALRECLPAPLWETLVATAGDPGSDMAFLTERLRTLVVVPDPPDDGDGAGHHAVSRLTLRQVLLSGLDDVAHFDKEFTAFERTPDGRVTARFTDGSEATGDVLVGADGANSRVRRQYLPHAQRIETDVVAVGGKLPLTEATAAWLPSRILAGKNVVFPRRHAMFTAVFRRREHGRDPAGRDDDYVLWAFAARRDAYPADAPALDGAALQRQVGAMIRGWHPDLRRLVADSPPETVNLFPFKTSLPVAPWPSTNVTLLGDAIHSMTPAAGIGGNTALRDASLLRRALTAVHCGEKPLAEAIGAYEAEMRDYGFAAARQSLFNARAAIAPPAVHVAARTFFRLCGALPALRRVTFGD